jgi:hypothetical protein
MDVGRRAGVEVGGDLVEAQEVHFAALDRNLDPPGRAGRRGRRISRDQAVLHGVR